MQVFSTNCRVSEALLAGFLGEFVVTVCDLRPNGEAMFTGSRIAQTFGGAGMYGLLGIFQK